MYKLKVIVASTRPTRQGKKVADWFMESIAGQDFFEVELLDLKEIDLPMMNEPNHPKLQDYKHSHTRAWSKIIDEADAFVIVTCEYNYGFPAPLKNALDYLSLEWNYKPVGFVSYGGIGGGMRAVELLKPVLTTLKMVPLFEAVNIPFFTDYINEDGEFMGTERHARAADKMIKELVHWVKGLKVIREDVKVSVG